MKKFPKISDAEWQVMKVLWEESPLTSGKIIDTLHSITTWSPKTIRTLITRLVKKGALGVNTDAKLNLYFPLVSEEECKKEETKSFLERVYNGSVQLLVANFIKDKKLSPEEIEELKAILEDKRN